MTVAAPLRLPMRRLPAAVARPVDLPPMLYLDPAIARDAGLTMGQIVRMQIGHEERLVRLGPMLTSLAEERAGFLPAALYTEAGEATVELLAEAPTLSRVVVAPTGDATQAAMKMAVARLVERRPLLHAGDLLDLGSVGNVQVVACSPRAGVLHEETEILVGDQPPPVGEIDPKEKARIEGMVVELKLAQKAVGQELQNAETSFQSLSETTAALDDECNSLTAELANIERSAAEELARRGEERDRLTEDVAGLRQEVAQLRQRAQLGPPPSGRVWRAP